MKSGRSVLPVVLSMVVAMGSSPAHATGLDREAIVSAHNKWRAEVGAGKLSYSTELEASAQAWADTLKQRYDCQPRHVPNGDFGENLHWASAVIWRGGRRELQQVTAEQIVDNWASEKNDYDHASNLCAPGKTCGHYTQIVWAKTEKVGCGYAICEDSREQVWVCRYYPAGNRLGERPY